MFDQCPRADKLRALAVGEAVSARVQSHVEVCETCNRIVSNLGIDFEFEAQLRRAAKLRLDPATRDRVLEVCTRAIEEARLSG